MSYFMITVPSEGSSRESVWSNLQSRTTQESDLSTNYKINVPDLRVGTLDSLMALSDDLQKIDHYVENVTHKVEKDLRSHSRTSSEALTINQTPVDHYLTRFKWEEARYPIKSSLRELVEKIQSQVSSCDDELKSRSADFNSVAGSLNAIQRRLGGSLMTRSLHEVVKPRDVVNSNSLCTLFVVVPRSSVKDWTSKYETMCQFVVPRSSRQCAEDNENTLHSVVLFKRVVDEFKQKCRDNRFTVREYDYDADAVAKEKEEQSKLEMDKERMWSSLTRWLMRARPLSIAPRISP